MTRAGIQIRPIRTDSDHEKAVARISELMGAASGTAEGDELDVLATLVDAYEAKRFPVDAPDPVTAIQFRMEQQGLKRRDLEPLIGSRARVSEVLTRKRNLTLEMIRRVKCGLGISADLLIGATPVRGRRHSTDRTVQGSRHKTRGKARTTSRSRKTA
jgi:HTH-type transcriptional regulator/antitoxin HigA